MVDPATLAWVALLAAQEPIAPAPAARPGETAASATPLESLDEALAAATDAWGRRALAQPEGPTYEFFAALLPPLRYVNAAFREAPIVLADPRGRGKVRVNGDGSGLLARANHEYWLDVAAPPIAFLVEDQAATPPDTPLRPFGAGGRLTGPLELHDGWIPRVTFREPHAEIEVGVVGSPAALAAAGGSLVHVRCRALASRVRFALELGVSPLQRALFAEPWRAGGQRLEIELAAGAGADVLLAAGPTLPGQPDLAKALGLAGHVPPSLPADWSQQALADWRHALGDDFRLVTPEPRVDAAWRATLAGTLALFEGDTLLYSAQNGYHRTFQAECGDAVRALWRFGVPDSERALDPLLARPLQQGIEAHDVAFKAMALREWWTLELGRLAELEKAGAMALQARTAVLARATQRIERVVAEVAPWLAQLDPEHGLLPKQAYCGDIQTPVHNLHTNASFWRGVRDLGLTCAEAGGALERDHAKRLMTAAATLRQKLEVAVAKSVDSTTSPPFVPMALFGAEQAYPQLTATMTGSYWNLVAPYAAASGIFGLEDPRLRWLLEYPETHGGLCMGMIRFDQHSGLFANTEGVDDLYTQRRAELLLQLDRADDAVVAFYGKLAQGMTRGTFASGEGSSLRPLDQGGRPLYLPPNASGSAFFLSLLRGMVVLEVDGDGDGASDELRLAHATPRAWFGAAGARLEVAGAPTSFGSVSFTLKRSADGKSVAGRVELPAEAPPKVALRLRLPKSLALGRVGTNAGVELPRRDRETIELSGRSGSVEFTAGIVTALPTEAPPRRPGRPGDSR